MRVLRKGKKRGHEEGLGKRMRQERGACNKVKNREMKDKLGTAMPKNGHIGVGWERARPRRGHSSHSC